MGDPRTAQGFRSMRKMGGGDSLKKWEHDGNRMGKSKDLSKQIGKSGKMIPKEMVK